MKWLDERILILNENDFEKNGKNFKSNIFAEMAKANVVVKIDDDNNIGTIFKNKHVPRGTNSECEFSSLPRSIQELIIKETPVEMKRTIPPKINKFYYIANNYFE
jgi:hypothetical protein